MDHIEEAKDLVSDGELQAARTHAQIAIAEELRMMNELTTLINTPVRYLTNDIDVNSVDDALAVIKAQGDYQSHVYPFGRQP